MGKSLRGTVLRCLIVAPLILGIAGCGGPPGYVLSAVTGQLEFLNSAEDIEPALQDPSLTDEQRDKLAFVVRARDYAEQEIGLNAAGSYQQFVNLHGEPLAWNLSASRRDALEPYVWSFTFFGSFPFLGFFDKDEALAERDRLKKAGYDTLMYELDTYAIQFLADPITSAMLERDYGLLADTVMHELAHNTVYRDNDSTFNESMATYVGRTAGMEFLIREMGPDAEIVRDAQLEYEDSDRFNVYLQGLIDGLQPIYQNDQTLVQKLGLRKVFFENAQSRFADEILPLMHRPEGYEGYTELTLNNAFLLAYARYHRDLDLFDAVYQSTGQDWGLTIELFRQAALAPDAFAFMRDVVEGAPAAAEVP